MKEQLKQFTESSENVSFSGIRVLTGTPGAGKSLRMIWLMTKALEQGLNVFVCNMPSCRVPGIQWLENPHDWETLPPGSVLFVDEGQKFFRQRRAGVPVPESILAMETLRHRAISIVITTQQPTYLDSHLRGLVSPHEHLVRAIGNRKAANVYQLRELYEDIKSNAIRETADCFTWDYPVELYALYDSAEVHTVKPFMPKKMKLVIILGGAAACLFAFVGYRVFIKEKPAPDATQAAPAAVAQEREGRLSIPRTLPEYLKQQTAIIPAQPWTAPMYGDMQPKSQPMLYCMAGDLEGHNPSCNCVTEQGTKYYLEFPQCVTIAKNGLYNPNKEFRQEVQQSPPVVYDPLSIDTPMSVN